MQVNESALVQMKRKTAGRLQKGKQRGVTLVELSVAVAVMGLIMAGALVGVPKLMDGVRTTQEIKALQQAVVNTQNAITLGTLKKVANAQDVTDLNLLDSLTTGTTANAYVNRFGGEVTVEAPKDAAIKAGYALKYTMIPVSACEKMVASLESNFTEIYINDVLLKNRSKSEGMDKVSRMCKGKADLAKDASNDVPASRADILFTIAS
ncbi:type 4 pilus major pilin [Pandoraea sp. NPDC087047]|uniref:type 4 pilus major pilin n=1 Tax=Pandoraea sp. NPDC087047 TaxID=3364390 RepID=UPI0037F67B56